MEVKTKRKLQYFVVICNHKPKDKIINLLTQYGGHEIDTIYGKGSAKTGILAQAFGFDIEEHKAVISCLIATEKAEELMKVLREEYNFDKQNTGIAFSVSVDGLVF